VLTDDGEKPQPACVSTCITGARVFGDLDDPESEVSQAIIKYNARPLAGNLTASKIYYVR
jgi:Fe-S-cluster-containing dehydrogenase component